VQGFHFNPSLAHLCSNKTPTQIQHMKENLPIQSNRAYNLTSFPRRLPVHQDAGDTEESVFENQDSQPSIKSPPSPNIDHPPIRILSDTDFATQGWPGSGNATDPYRITDLNINGSGTASDCIEIRNTTVHFIIANCLLLEASDHAGIHLFNTTNGTVQNNVCYRVHTGVLLTKCASTTIQQNTVFHTKYGAQLNDGSQNNTLRANRFQGPHDPYIYDYGIFLSASSNNIILNNTFVQTNMPITLSISNQNEVNNNTLYRHTYDAITLRHSHNNTINDNYTDTGTILLDASNSNIIQGNSLIGTVRLRINLCNASKFNKIQRNTLIGHIDLDEDSSKNWITNNTAESQSYFIQTPTEDIIVTNNSLINCGIEFSKPISYINVSNFQGNTINDQPIIVQFNQTDPTLPLNIGQAVFVNCSNIQIETFDVQTYTTIFQIYFSTNVTIHQNSIRFSAGSVGTTVVKLVSCESCTITENEFRPMGLYGTQQTVIKLQKCNLSQVYRNAFENGHYGIYISESADLEIRDNQFIDNWRGIYARNYTSLVIRENFFYDNFVGISCYYGDTYSIIDNSIRRSIRRGIETYANDNGLIFDNYFDANEIGIFLELEHSCVVADNFCYGSLEYGIWGTNLQLVNISHNYCRHTPSGIALYNIDDASECAISNNLIINCVYGISLERAHTVIITGNNCSHNIWSGITLQEGSGNYLADNFCSNNLGMGIQLQKENYTAIIWNSLLENGYGLHLGNHSSFNQILSNTFLWNRVANTLNEGRNNIFDGNFWSDYEGWDLNFDEFGDIPYQIPGLFETVDYHPRGFTLMKTLQMWVMILFVCLSLLATIILGRHLLISAEGEEAWPLGL
jgi:parallel beta-helix repeat protein